MSPSYLFSLSFLVSFSDPGNTVNRNCIVWLSPARALPPQAPLLVFIGAGSLTGVNLQGSSEVPG